MRRKVITVSWKDDPPQTAAIARTKVMRDARPVLTLPNQAIPDKFDGFPSVGGLGLHVGLGVASFRNVVLEPLDDDNTP
jgi:hypothetical protein